tara:strand:+ start:1482 stop:3770 length:2289 start_codon:yes stop_codon:yes gene_type:complete
MLTWTLPTNTTCTLDGLVTTEIIPTATLDRLISSSLLKESFNNKYAGLTFKNERAQLVKLRANLKGDLSEIRYTRPVGMSFGRVNPVGAIGLASIRREIRHTLARDNYVDIDIDNAHPVFCLQYCQANDTPCEKIADYVNNRASWLNRVSEAYLQGVPAVDRRDAAKKLFIRLMYHGSFGKWLKETGLTRLLAHRELNQFLADFTEEIANVAQIIIDANPRLHAEIESRKVAQGKLDYNEPGTNASYFFQHIECVLLESMYTYANGKGLIDSGNVVLCADGLMLLKGKYNDGLLAEFKQVILDNHGLDVGVSQKLMTQGFTEDQIEATQIPEVIDPEPSYDDMKVRFERTHCKIVSKAMYICEGDQVLYYTEQKFKSAYRELKYYAEGFNKKGESVGLKPNKFIDKWMDDEKLRKYRDVAIYPPPLVCPADIYNLWVPFRISRYTSPYAKHEVGLERFKSHIHILCGEDEPVAEYFTKWLAQMFQYPATKTVMPTFISEEGAGKGTLIELISAMMGAGKTLVTTQPSRDVWGDFNALMCSAFFVNLNEMSPKETKDSIGKIKGLITDPQLTINKKGIDAFTIESFHRFLGTTNNEDPWKVKKDDRRNLIIRSSDTLCGDKEYFTETHALFQDLTVRRTIYDYLMSIPDMDKFGSLPMPTTQYQEDVKEANRSVIDRWVEDLAGKSTKDLCLDSVERLQSFNHFCEDNGFNYEVTAVKLTLALKRLNIPGVSFPHTMAGTKTLFHMSAIRGHYPSISGLDFQV